MSQENQTITIGPRFFQTEKSNYANWREAFAREVIQNSADSNSSLIEINLQDIEEETVITIADNGHGMPINILKDKFMVMGETGKTGSDTVGGFGKARVLIAWAANSYEIRSCDYLVRGCGAGYEINTPMQGVAGCTFVVRQPKADWLHYFQKVIDNCHLPFVKFKINGEFYKSQVKHRGRMVRELSFGAVFVNKSEKSHRLIVKVAGVFMFERQIAAPAQVIIEILPDKSKETLLSNRDSLTWQCQNELNIFLDELAADTRSALTNKMRKFTIIRNRGKGLLALSRKQQSDSVSNLESATFEEFAKQNPDPAKLNIILNSGSVDNYQNLQVNSVISDPVTQSMLIHNESNCPKKINLINSFYHPEKWTPTSTRYQLLKIWAAINAIVVEELATMLDTSISYGSGWVFCDDEDRAEAMHKEIEGVHYLLLNPIDAENKIKYSVNSVDDYFDLIVLSVHEVAHHASAQHNEQFSTTMTLLMQKAMARRKEIVNACKDAK